MYTKPTLLSLVAILAAFHPMAVRGGRAKPSVRRANFSSTSPPPTLPSILPGVVGQLGFWRFHANDSLIGRDVLCTRDEKICFRHNMIFDPKSDRCQPLGAGHPPGCDLRPNRTEYEHGSKHIYGVCNKYQDPCPGYRMAYDGRCYRKQIVRDVICGCSAQPTRHFLYGVECRCFPTPQVAVKQPKGNGYCSIPDLRFPVDLSAKFQVGAPPRHAPGRPAAPPRAHPGPASCSPEQRACFAAGHVWVAAGRGCFPLLQRGPCPEGQVVVLSRTAWTRASAECKPLGGGCPPAQRRMAFDSHCHDSREMKLLAPGRIALDIFGEYEVTNFTEVRSHMPGIFNGSCVVFDSTSVIRLPSPEKVPKPSCAPGNKDLCSLHEVVRDLPLSDVDHYVDNTI